MGAKQSRANRRTGSPSRQSVLARLPEADQRLLISIQGNSEEGIVRALAEGANINASLLSFTPLQFAIECKNPHIVNVLLENHADPDYINGTGATALHFSLRINSVEITRLLLTHGANPYLATRQPSPYCYAEQNRLLAHLALFKEHSSLRREPARITTVPTDPSQSFGAASVGGSPSHTQRLPPGSPSEFSERDRSSVDTNSEEDNRSLASDFSERDHSEISGSEQSDDSIGVSTPRQARLWTLTEFPEGEESDHSENLITTPP